MSDFEYVRQYYGVPAEIGRAVVAYGKPGVIAEDKGQYIGILLDCDKPGDIGQYHPTDGIEYLPDIKPVRQQTVRKARSKARYQRYLEYCDCFDSFLDFCYWDAQQRW